MIGDREIELEEPEQGPEKALRLSERELEDHANRQCDLDRNVRVGTLATGFAAGRSSPRIERVIREPDGQVAATPKTGLVLRPIPQTISRLCVLVLAASGTSQVMTPGSGALRPHQPKSGAMHLP